MLMAYLPKEKILFTADFNLSGAGTAGQPVDCRRWCRTSSGCMLDFDRHVMVHPPNPDRPMTKADLLALVKEAK